MASEQIRCFIALPLPDEVTDALSQVQDQLRERAEKFRIAEEVRWPPRESIHLTLKFLGNIPARQVDDLQSALVAKLDGRGPLTLSLGSVGAFPSPRRPRVIWVGVQGDLAALASLQQRVESAAALLGYRLEERAFSPHLTIGRVRVPVQPDRSRGVAQLVADLVEVPRAKWVVGEVEIVQSVLRREGALYTTLASISLRGA